MNDLYIREELVAQTYDGAAGMSGHFGGLQTEVNETFPQALFVHCYSHFLNLVVQQAAMYIDKCRLFFQTLRSLSSFFLHLTKRTESLRSFMKRKLPKPAPTHWNFNPRLVITVQDQQENQLLKSGWRLTSREAESIQGYSICQDCK